MVSASMLLTATGFATIDIDSKMGKKVVTKKRRKDLC